MSIFFSFAIFTRGFFSETFWRSLEIFCSFFLGRMNKTIYGRHNSEKENYTSGSIPVFALLVVVVLYKRSSSFDFFHLLTNDNINIYLLKLAEINNVHEAPSCSSSSSCGHSPSLWIPIDK